MDLYFKLKTSRFPELASWSKAIATNDNEQKRDSIDSVSFHVYRDQYVRREKQPLVQGAIASADTTLLLRTDFDCSSIEQDDLIMYDGKEWSVTEVQPVRSTVGYNSYEWAILCH